MTTLILCAAGLLLAHRAARWVRHERQRDHWLRQLTDRRDRTQPVRTPWESA